MSIHGRMHTAGIWHSVFLGVYDDIAEAQRVVRRYRKAERKSVFIKTLDRRVIAAGETGEIISR